MLRDLWEPNGAVLRRDLDPRDVPALKAGGIWLPGEGVSTIGAGPARRWASQSDNTGDDYDLKDSHTGQKPILTTADNGAPIWDLADAGSQAGWSINTGTSRRAPGAALQFTQRGSMAGWFKANDLDSSIHYLFSMWPGGSSGNRIVAYKNNDEHRIAIFVSWNGDANDTGTPLHRAKWNSSDVGLEPLIDWTQWQFVRIEIDMTGENFTVAGAKFSTRMRVFLNEVELTNNAATGTGSYSAGSPPEDGGPFAGIWDEASMFSVGADFLSSHWNGQIGPIYISNEDNAPAMTRPEWKRVMRYRAPGA